MSNLNFKKFPKILNKSKKYFISVLLLFFVIWIILASIFWIKPSFTAQTTIKLEKTYNATTRSIASFEGRLSVVKTKEFFENALKSQNASNYNKYDRDKIETSIKIEFNNALDGVVYIDYTDITEDQAKDILTALVSHLVETTLETEKLKQDKININLESKLLIAENELKQSAQELHEFKTKNPWVSLDGAIEESIKKTSYNEIQKAKLNNKRDRLKSLKERLQSDSLLNNNSLIAEINFFDTKGEYVNLNSQDIEDTGKKNFLITADSLLFAYNQQLNDLDEKIIQERNYKIRGLPEKQTELANLERKYNVSDKIYASLYLELMKTQLGNEEFQNSIQVISPAKIVSQKTLLSAQVENIFLGLILSIVVGLIFVILPKLLSKTIIDSEDLYNYFKLPVLVKVPEIQNSNGLPDHFELSKGTIEKKLVTTDYSPSIASESFRNLRAQLLFNENSERRQSLFVTSTNSGEGKSLSVANLSITIAQQKIQTLLVDADLRRGLLHDFFGLKKDPGFSDFLFSKADVNEKNISSLIQKTHVPNLFLMTAGRPIPNPSEMIGSDRFKKTIDYFKERFGFVLIDTPPMVVAADSFIISNFVDFGLLLVRCGLTKINTLQEKLNEFSGFSDRFKGILLNYADVKEISNQPYSYYNY